MNCVLFAKMDQVSSKENKTLKKYWNIGKKNAGKVREFCQSGKVGTMASPMLREDAPLNTSSDSLKIGLQPTLI